MCEASIYHNLSMTRFEDQEVLEDLSLKSYSSKGLAERIPGRDPSNGSQRQQCFPICK